MEEFVEDIYLSLYSDVADHVRDGALSSGRQHFDKYGRAEGRWPMNRTREDKIFDGLDRLAPGLEIGASYNPVITGKNVKILDHLDQAGLIAKYGAHIDVSKVSHVDYVWGGERLTDLVKERFDWVVASHVIEHVPNLIGFLNDCAELLNPGGVLSLAVPDRRYSFDYYRAPSSLASIADAHFEGRTRPSRGAVLEHFRQYSEISSGCTWDATTTELPKFPPDTSKALLDLEATGAYVDTHVWVFTPNRFRMIMMDLRDVGLIELKEARFYPTVGCEFFIQLSKTAPGPRLSREILAQAAATD